MNQRKFLYLALIIGIIAVAGAVGYLVTNLKLILPQAPILFPPSTSNPLSAQTTSSIQDSLAVNECGSLLKYNTKAYQDGWEKIFKKENNLSDSQFNTYIKITSTSLKPLGDTCELTVKYKVMKDWLVVDQADSMTLGVPPNISPDNLPRESDPATDGRMGVSAVNLNDKLSFGSQSEALNFYVDKYNLQNTDARVQNQGYQYFYNKESAEKSGVPFAGEGGEAVISVFGTIDRSQNKCFSGDLSLVTRETTYHDMPCGIN